LLAGATHKFEFLGFNDGISYGNYFTVGENQTAQIDLYGRISAVPVPAAAFLFAPAMIGLVALRRKQKMKA